MLALHAAGGAAPGTHTHAHATAHSPVHTSAPGGLPDFAALVGIGTSGVAAIAVPIDSPAQNGTIAPADINFAALVAAPNASTTPSGNAEGSAAALNNAISGELSHAKK